jgi:hypothetical protein
MLENRIVERFWSRVDKKGPDDCWPWLGTRLPAGYGTFGGRRGEHFYAHRVGFENQNGHINPELLVCHSCDNPPCCNGRHLFQGTHGDNSKDKWSKGRGFTPFGMLVQIGEDHPGAKLDANTVRLIRRLRAETTLNLDEIGARIGVGKSTISRVINRDPVGGWAHVV